jgi:hypothetical protein
MCGSRYATAVFITSATASQLLCHRRVEVGLDAVAFAVDGAPRKPFQERQFRQFGCALLLNQRTTQSSGL